uniref:Transposase n=1 Tax=Romanomermis culicivorax TaxID=13658 RepID=A0A915INA8_ROMCU
MTENYNFEQRAVIRYLMRKGRKVTEIHTELADSGVRYFENGKAPDAETTVATEAIIQARGPQGQIFQ